MAGIEKWVSKGIAGTSLWSSRHAKAVVATVLVLTVVAGYGVTLITTNVDVADVLPRGNPNTSAAHNLTNDFKSTFTQQVTFQVHVDESTTKWRTDNAKLQYRNLGFPAPEQQNPSDPNGPGQVQPDPTNITDEVYVRAIEEMVRFIQERTDFTRAISEAGIYSLINWTIAGGEGQAPEEAFALPGYTTPDQAMRYQLVDQTVKAAVLDTVDALSSPSWNHAAVLFMPPADSDRAQAELGRQIIAARNAYVAAVDAGETEWTVFGSDNPPLLTVDLPVANAHSSELVEQDMFRLMPMIAAFIMVCLFIAFRNIRSIAISFTALGVGVTWTYGTMGYMGIALNTLNMTIVPLIMGVGIDYAIHMINEFLEHKSEGKSDAEAFSIAGERAGLAMFIATLTTVLGLIVMMMSPSLLMAQLGLLAAIAIAAIYILTITFIPAALTLLGGTSKMGASFTPSKIMPFLARGVSKARYLVLLAIIIFTGLAVVGSQNLENEAFGDPGKNYLPDDPIRQEHEQGLRYFYEMEEPDVKANILTFEGPGILTPEAMEYMRAIERSLMTKDRVIADTLRTVPFFIETWQTVKAGGPCAGLVVADGRSNGALDPILAPYSESPGPCASSVEFPNTEEKIRNEINAMFNSPMAQLASLIINHPDNDIAAMTFSVRAATFDEAAQVWEQVWEAVDEANRQFGGQPPEGVQVAFVGNTATNYLFIEEQLPWLTYMSIAATVILFGLVYAFTRDWKATVIATFAAGATSIWWLGILPLIDIGLAITLMLPLVFIFNIGTDYVVHIIWNLKQIKDGREVFGTVGKAILFSAVTTAGAFAFFIMIQNVAVSRTMVATTLSILVIFVATMLIIPAFYRVQAKGEAAAGTDESGGTGSDETPMAPAAPVKVTATKRPKTPGAVKATKRVKAG